MTSWNGAVPHGALGALVDCLEQVQSLRDPASRRLCLSMLGDELGRPLVVDDLPTTRAQLIGIVRACQRRDPRALSLLIDVAEDLEPGSIPIQRARAAVEDMTALNLVGDEDRRELLGLLGGSASAGLAEFIRSILGPEAQLTTADQYPAEAVASLERMNAQADGMPPLLVFVERLAVFFGDVRSVRLRTWNDRQAQRMGLTDKLLAIRREQPAVEPSRPKDPLAYLVIRIEPDMLDPDVLTVTHWRHCDHGEWQPRRGESFSGGLDAIRLHVAGLVGEAEASWAKAASAIRIEFLLPYALLNLPVDQWDLETGSMFPRPAGVHYQVVIRSLDRARAPSWHREWRQRWEQLSQAPADPAMSEKHWLWSEGAKPRQLGALDAKLAAHKEVVFLVLRSVPDRTEPGEVVLGLRSGVPVMIWQRTAAGRSTFETAVKSLRDAVPELSEQLRLLRTKAKQAPRPETHVGSRIVLLWDDPYRPVEPLAPPATPFEEVPAR